MTASASIPTADETRDRILREAERLFRYYGYAKTTVADIASACAMSPSNVYRFFASKSAINEAICARIIADSELCLRQIARREASASDRLKDFILEMHRFTVENLLDQKKVHEMVVVAMEEQWSAVETHIRYTRSLVEEIIASGIETGEFQAADASWAARCVFAALTSIKHPVIVAQCIDDPDRAQPEEMAAFLVAALKPNTRLSA